MGRSEWHRRANLNGSNRQDVVTGIGAPAGIALSVAPVSTDAPAAPGAVAANSDATALHANYPNPFNPKRGYRISCNRLQMSRFLSIVKAAFSSVNSLLGIKGRVNICRAAVRRIGMVGTKSVNPLRVVYISTRSPLAISPQRGGCSS